jgi:glycosyltransferase involved in cell wall biosynthesis
MSSTETKYKLAVVMPVRNEAKFIGQTLDQLYLQDFPMDRLEVVIADGNSTDSTRDIAQEYSNRFGSLKIINNPKQLPSSGRNVGVKNSTAPYILILDGHTYLPNKNLLKSVVETFESTQADCLCRSQPLNPPDINEFEKTVSICRASSLGHNPDSDIYSGSEGSVDPTSSGAMYRREVFDQIGYFDEDFDACEDVDFNHRVKKAGLKSYLSSTLKVLYYPRSTLAGLWKQMNRYGKGRFNFSKKHELFAPMHWMAAGMVIGLVILMILSFLSSWFLDLFRMIVAVYLLIVISFSVFLYFREKHFGCLLYGILIFPTIHFGLGFGFLWAFWSDYTKKSEQ